MGRRTQKFSLEANVEGLKIEAELPKAESGLGFLGRGSKSHPHHLGSLGGAL